MRRQTEADAIRVAAGVLFTVAGIIGEHAPLVDESPLVRDIAVELHSMSRHLREGAHHQPVETHQPLQHLAPPEMMQWERHLQEEEQEARGAAESLIEERDDTRSESSSLSARSQRQHRSWRSTISTSWVGTNPESLMRTAIVTVF